MRESIIAETEKIIFRFLEEFKVISRCQLIKLLYLYDLTCKQMNIDSGTGLPYAWHLQGPYCYEINVAINNLIVKKKINLKDNNPIYELVVNEELKLKPIEKNIIRYITIYYSKLSYDELKYFVFNTAPMIKARKGKLFDKLDMNVKSEELDNLPSSKTCLKIDLTYFSEFTSLNESIEKLEKSFFN